MSSFLFWLVPHHNPELFSSGKLVLLVHEADSEQVGLFSDCTLNLQAWLLWTKCMCYEQHPGRMHHPQGPCVIWSSCCMAWCPGGGSFTCANVPPAPLPGGTSQGFACCRTKSFPHVFPSGLNSYLICHSNISCRGMLNSKWHAQKKLLTACIVDFCYGFISDTRTLARIGCTRSLNRITGTSMRNFYQDNHIYTTTCASTTLSSRVGVIHLPQAAKGSPQMDFEWHPGRADTMQGVRSCVSWERFLSPASARARRCHRVQTQDDAEQVSGGTETARNQHLLAPAKFLLAGINCKNKNAARHTSPKWLLTTEVGSMIFFIFLTMMEILSSVA